MKPIREAKRATSCWSWKGRRRQPRRRRWRRRRQQQRRRSSSARNASWWIGHPWLIWQADFLVFGDWQGAHEVSAPVRPNGPSRPRCIFLFLSPSLYLSLAFPILTHASTKLRDGSVWKINQAHRVSVEILMDGRPFHSIIDTASEESKEVPRIRGQNKNLLVLSSLK